MLGQKAAEKAHAQPRRDARGRLGVDRGNHFEGEVEVNQQVKESLALRDPKILIADYVPPSTLIRRSKPIAKRPARKAFAS